ncbi:MAG: cytochrome c family protein [Pseudomonadota bacterium]
MKFLGNGLKSAAAASALSIFLVACGGGGSEPAASTETPAATEVEAAATEVVEEVVEVAEDTAADAVETIEVAAEDVTEAAEETVADATETVEDAAEVVEAAAEDVTEAAEEVVEAAAEAAPELDERVSPEVAAEYAALTGDAGNGRRVFTQCMSCHAVQEGRNMAGPSLYKIIGRSAGSVEGFRYSDANAGSGIVWTEETMFAYLEQPQRFIPGTNMAFPGLRRAQDRADVIAYLEEQSGE